jgi:prevent-host-death family protein
LERVARGEKIIITKHGVPVAVLQPIDPKQQSEPELVIEKIKKFRSKNRLDGISLRELIEEGRR